MAQVVIVVTFLNSRDDSKILEKRSFELFCIKNTSFAVAFALHKEVHDVYMYIYVAAGCGLCTARFFFSSRWQLPVHPALDAHTSTLHVCLIFRAVSASDAITVSWMVRNVKGEIKKRRKKGENQTEHVPGKRRRDETIRPKSFFDERMWKKFT